MRRCASPSVREHRFAGSSPGSLRQAAPSRAYGAFQPGRRPGFEPPGRQLHFTQSGTQALGRRIARASRLVVLESDMNQPRQECAGGEHHRIRAENEPDLGHDPHHPIPFQQQVIDGLLEQRQIRLVFEARPDRLLVENAVCLCAGCADRGPLAGVEDPELDACLIRRDGHRPAQRVHLLDQVSLANAANGRVAGRSPNVSMLWVRRSVARPIRADASAASVPAWPPPTMITSKRCLKSMI